MPSSFLSERFLLDNKVASVLYHEYVKALPIVDYHSHLSPAEIASDRRFANLTQLWLEGDHYKWRAMRANGIHERFITGNAPDWVKFQKWAATVPKTLGNPLYHWVHLELWSAFGIGDVLLGPDTAEDIWQRSQALLDSGALSCQQILAKMNVAVLCTTDDPCDSLEFHQVLAQGGSGAAQIFPTFRPQKALAVDNPHEFNRWVDALAAVVNHDIVDFSGFLQALESRIDFFHSHGCRVADIGLEACEIHPPDTLDLAREFKALRAGKTLEPRRAAQVKPGLLLELARLYARKGWVQQLHIGAIRNLNTRGLRSCGADAGYDAIGDGTYALALARLLDRLDAEELLPKTILYNVNPRDNHMIASIAGCFQEGPTPGRIQFGPAWWFLDQRDGILEQLRILGSVGLLSSFVGMTTDSRSFLSFSRHDYFRRVLCSFLGEEIRRGRLPSDLALIGALAADICCRNAIAYFGFPTVAKPITPERDRDRTQILNR